MRIEEVKRLMARAPASHKGEHGFVLVVGGSQDYVGTLVLVGTAALRAGCDLVTIAAPQRVAWAINTLSPDLITKKLVGPHLVPRHLTDIKKMLHRFDVLVFGNGVGLHAKTKRFADRLMLETKGMPKVIDADGIKLLSLKQIDNAIITPHAVELRLLLENSGLEDIARVTDKDKQAKLLQAHVKSNVLLIKGPTDFIISKNRIIKVKGGNPGMGRAGMGDVLAGLCAGFLAQTRDLVRSAEAASTINKKMGDLLLKQKGGYAFIASDMLAELERFSRRV